RCLADIRLILLSFFFCPFLKLDISHILSCLLCDLLRRQTCFFSLLIGFFLILCDQFINIDRFHMTVDDDLLDASQQCTGDPVDTDTDGERQTHKSVDNRHICVHHSQGSFHTSLFLLVVCHCGLRHQLIVQPLGKPRQYRHQNCQNDHYHRSCLQASLEKIHRRLGNIVGQEHIYAGGIFRCTGDQI